jgi:hypothetical protein
LLPGARTSSAPHFHLHSIGDGTCAPDLNFTDLNFAVLNFTRASAQIERRREGRGVLHFVSNPLFKKLNDCLHRTLTALTW